MGPFYQSITDFIFVENEPAKAELIFLPGGPEDGPALRAAALFGEGYAPRIAISGRCSILNGEVAGPARAAGFDTECAYLADLLARSGVPAEALLLEERAQYTYQNAMFTRELLEEKGMIPARAILCCQAFHARRALLYYREQFPETEILVCPAVTKGISRESWTASPEGIDTVLGEVERCGSQFHEIMREHMTRE